jgi:hypothetical protein
MTSPRLLTSVIGMITVPSGQAQAKNPNSADQIVRSRHGASTFGPAWIRGAGRIGAIVSRNHRDSKSPMRTHMYERSIDLDLHSISKHASKDARLAVTTPGS